jgi:hypothetical protein
MLNEKFKYYLLYLAKDRTEVNKVIIISQYCTYNHILLYIKFSIIIMKSFTDIEILFK